MKDKLEAFGAVLIEGPRWCGKTTTAEQQASSILYMADPALVSQNKELARISPQILLDGAVPRFKLGGDRLISEGAASLLKLQSKIDTGKMKSPAFLMVLTAVGDYAYQREDGVYVVPIGSLKP